MTKPDGATSSKRAGVLRGLDVCVDACVRPLVLTRRTIHRLLAFSLIVLAALLTRSGQGRAVIRPLIIEQIRYAGLRLLPMIGLLSLVTGIVIIGQAVAVLRQIGAQDLLGTILVVTLFREFAPLGTALLVLLRVGTATVVELATMRATGEVEALEALSIDPIHYLVIPRVLGLAVSVICLTIYFLIGAILSGYLFCFVQGFPVTFGDYLSQIARALGWADFILLLLKTGLFGASLAVITCYQGLSRPLRLEQVPEATTRAVTHSLVTCVLLDGVFLGFYLVPLA